MGNVINIEVYGDPRVLWLIVLTQFFERNPVGIFLNLVRRFSFVAYLILRVDKELDFFRF
jgi:hypothetical protein